MADQFPYYFNDEFDEDTNKKVNMEILKYAGIYVLKKLDRPPADGGYFFEVPLMGLDEHLEPILDDLLFHDIIEIDVDHARYSLTKEGIQYIDKLIDEIEGYIDKYQEYEPVTRVNLMKRDKINPLRARFLWGLYDGEFDDFDQWQENWNIAPDEKTADWREIITMKEFYDMLFEDINQMDALDDDALDEVLAEAEADRLKEKKAAPPVQINRIEGSRNSDNRNQYDNYEPPIRDNYYYHDPYYFNPVYDPLFWYMVF